ncbi:MAG: hypothetical protein FDW93_05080 [Bergeyella sp.]|nr:hypothetical protein [Bergeyella sp.]
MGFIRKIVNRFLNQQEQSMGILELGEQLRHADLDYKFAKLFTHSGGFFNYCSDESEALQILRKIVEIEQVNSVFCFDEDLKNFLSVLNVSQSEILDSSKDTAFISCEYLIAYDGRIMLSHNNILQYHVSKLPPRVIIMAHVSQIVSNLNSAMSKVKNKGSLKNITSIGGEREKIENIKKDHTKLFLLLIED